MGCALYNTKTGKRCSRRVSQSAGAKRARREFGAAARACMRSVGTPDGTKTRMKRIGACVKQKLRA